MSNFVDIYEHIFDQRTPATFRAGAKNDTRSNLPSNFKSSVSSDKAASRSHDHARRRSVERWYLVHTQAGKELQVRMQLQIQGFRTFLPQYLRTSSRTDQLHTVRISQFPSYVFVHLNLNRDRLRAIRSMAGVESIVGVKNVPTVVPPGLVEALMAHADDTMGPFSDFLAVLDHTDEAGRVRLLIETIGSETSVTLPRAGFSPAA